MAIPQAVLMRHVLDLRIIPRISVTALRAAAGRCEPRQDDRGDDLIFGRHRCGLGERAYRVAPERCFFAQMPGRGR
jgi:hypothetical protein